MQIKVLVAEDEAPILRSVCKSITRTNPNFVVVETATNGRQAMELIDKNPEIQVVFLDINMPIVNGIRLLEFLQEQHPHILSVVLSGYQNFDYAQQALKYGAKSYLLKPLRTEELAEVLGILQTAVIAQNERNLALMFRDLPTDSSIPTSQMERKVFVAAVFVGSFWLRRLSNFPSEVHSKAENEVRTLLDETYGTGNYCLASDARYAAKILTVSAEQQDSWPQDSALFRAIRANLFEVPVTFICQKTPMRFADIAKQHYLMRMLSWRDMLFDTSALLTLPEHASEESLQQKEHHYEGLFACINNNTTREEALGLYRNALHTNVSTRTEVLRLTKYFFHAALTVHGAKSSYFSIEESVMDLVETTWNKDALLRKVSDLLEIVWAARQNENISKERLAQMMEQYLTDNLEQPINLETLEKRFGYTAAYLREIFRAVYQVSPQEYLLQLRIERAKQMLKAGMSAKTVALATGFTDPLYFSKVFKKQTGISPSSYKNDPSV